MPNSIRLHYCGKVVTGVKLANQMLSLNSFLMFVTHFLYRCSPIEIGTSYCTNNYVPIIFVLVLLV